VIGTVEDAKAGRCNCDACKGLADYYGSDPVLHNFYRRRLLVRGWAGRFAIPCEKAYILAHAEFAKAGAATLAKFGAQLFKSQPTGVGNVEEVSEDLGAEIPTVSASLAILQEA
jgi:hypothetical protein